MSGVARGVEVEVVQAYRFALDPTPAQARALASHCGASRKAFNTMLAAVKANMDQRGAERTYGLPAGDLTPALGWSAYSLRRDWNRRKGSVAPWWAENSKEAYAAGCANLARALGHWSASRRGTRRGAKAGFPRFRSKHGGTPSCTFTTGSIRVDADRRHVTLPVIGLLRTHESTRKLARRLEAGTARIGAATIRCEGGRWFVSFVTHVRRDLSRPGHIKAGAPVVGIDVGVRDLIVVAAPDGRELERVPAPKHLRSGQRKLRALQRKAARQRGPWDPHTRSRREPSTGWRHTQTQIRRAHTRIANRRTDHLHRTTTRLAQRHQVLGVETLAVRNMMRAPAPRPEPDKPGAFLPNNARAKAGLARSLADASFGALLRMLGYKTTWYGSRIVKAGRWMPSSKTCSGCGSVKAKLTLAEREFTCTDCGLVIDRDLNAATNLARVALAGCTTGGSGPLDTGGAGGKTRVRAHGNPRTPDPARGCETGTQHAGTVCP